MHRFPLVSRIVVTLASIAAIVGVTAIGLLYNAAIEEKKRDLLAMATSIASLIDSIADYESRLLRDVTPEVALSRTLTQFKSAFESVRGIGETGEVIIFSRHDRGFKILVHQEKWDGTLTHPDFVAEDSAYAAPMLAAMSSEAGVMGNVLGPGGTRRLVAYAPINGVALGVMVEVHSSEVEKHFVRAIGITLGIALIIIVVGSVYAYRETMRVTQNAIDNEQRFRDFAESSSDYFWETDTEGRISSVIFGKEFRFLEPAIPSLLGKTRLETAHEDTNTEKWQQYQRDVDARRPIQDFRYEILVAPIEDTPRIVSVFGKPIYDSKGKFIGYRGSGSDITKRLRQDDLLAQAEQRLRIAFETITVGIILIDENGTIENVNPKAKAIFGYRARDLVGKNVSMLMPEPDRGRHDRYIQNYLNTREAKIIGIGREVTGLRSNGEEFPMHLGVAEMRLRGERHFIGSISDLTREKTLETQLRRSQKMDAIGQLSGGIAHDFNNVLGIIVGNLDLARRRLDPADKIYKNVQKAFAAAERGSTLTRRLLNFSRQTPVESETIDINAAINNVRELLEQSLTKDIEVSLVLDKEAWPVSINKGDFEDALVNLAINARDAMPNGGTLTIETSRARIEEGDSPMFGGLERGDYVEINVSDSGEGIAEDVVSRIFDPFFTTKEIGHGTGLGLAMVYGFVQRSRGAISVYSEPGVGTTFRIYLPRATNGDETAKTDAQQVEDLLHGNGEAILVVDDEEELLELAAAMLQEAGYRTQTATTGKQALEMLSKKGARFELILTDIVMPGGVNGFDLAELAHTLDPSTRILLASGFTPEVMRKNFASRRMFPMIKKPYNARELLRAVRRALDDDSATNEEPAHS